MDNVDRNVTEQKLPPRVVRWTQKLLDLSLRNRMLNVRDVKQVIPLACRDVARLEDQLASDEVVSIAFGDPTENFLVSGCTPDETKRRLKVLFRVAKSDLEESGVNTLFLAIGFLRWKVSPKDEKSYRAPLLLMPVKLVRKGVSDFRLAQLDEETIVNATLLELLRSQYRVTVPDVDPPPQDAHGVDVTKVVEAFRAAVKDQPGWEVTRELALGQFSFGKFVMWKDLTGRLDALRQHALVDHLVCGGGVFDDGVKVFPPEEIAKNIQPAELFCPLSADSSQLAAVLYSQLGKTFVLHGPPGTGKSQTITNLIAHNLAHGRRVLFVSEKKAALDVVHNRLAKIGLKPFCLELHSNKSGKTEVLAQFAEALNVPDCRGPQGWTLNADQLDTARGELDAYVRALHRVYPNGLSAYDCFALAIAEGGLPEGARLSIDTLTQTQEAREEARQCAVRLANDWAATSPDVVDALAPAKDADWSPVFERNFRAAVQDLAASSRKGFFGRLMGAFRNRAYVPFGTARKLTPEAADALGEASDGLRGALGYRASRADAVQRGLAPLVRSLEGEGFDAEEAARRFDAAYAAKMIDDVVGAQQVLARFTGISQEERVMRFRALDEQAREEAKGEVFSRLAARLPRRRAEDCPAASELGILRRECEKKARHKPVRQLLAEIPSLAPVLKPCFLMSPLSVAQYLPPDAAPFDLVVFDEASQIPVWDAIGVIARAKQLVVVGDPKQMPPTNFFQKGESEADAEDEDVPEDMESILDECLAAGVYSSHLSWHYRSRHESLIAFSNHNYYDDRLNTFPCARTTPRLGVRFEFVEGGVYDRRATRTNEVEARALVDYIFAKAKEPGYKPRSIGVVTFSQAQQELIEDLVDARREKDPSLETLFAEDAPEPFFVKNLENVQGDERDVILFSVGYAPDADGKFAMNFGPLNRDGGERRLNVAVTRAKEQVVVFASIHGSQIDLSRTSATGAAHLRSFLEYAEKQMESVKCKMENAGEPRLSRSSSESFPATVAAFLREHKWEVDEQVGASAFRIDLGVRHPNGDGYLLAIECDGPAYAAQRTVRDRDELRASVLKGLGWYVTRIWSVDWALDRKRAEESLLGLLDALETSEPPSSTGTAAAAGRSGTSRSPRSASSLPPGVTAVRASAARHKQPAKRAIDTIPLDELAQAMRDVETDFGACERDALYRETLKRFGLTVLTPKARTYLDAAFRRK